MSNGLNFFAIVIAELVFDLFERLAHGFGDAQNKLTCRLLCAKLILVNSSAHETPSQSFF